MIHALQNSSLSLATTAPHAGVTSALPQQQSHYASSATTHTAHYTTQPAGWTISPTTQYIQQVKQCVSHAHMHAHTHTHTASALPELQGY